MYNPYDYSKGKNGYGGKGKGTKGGFGMYDHFAYGGKGSGKPFAYDGTPMNLNAMVLNSKGGNRKGSTSSSDSKGTSNSSGSKGYGKHSSSYHSASSGNNGGWFSSSSSYGKGYAKGKASSKFHSSSSSGRSNGKGKGNNNKPPRSKRPGRVEIEKPKYAPWGNLHLTSFNGREGCQNLRDMLTGLHDGILDPYICIRLQNVNPTSVFGPEFQTIAASYGVAMHKGFFCLTHSNLFSMWCEFGGLLGLRASGPRSAKAMVMSFSTLASKLGPETTKALLARADELSWQTMKMPERCSSLPPEDPDEIVDYRRGAPPASQYGIAHRPTYPPGLEPASSSIPPPTFAEAKKATRRSPDHAMRGFGNRKLESAPIYPPHYTKRNGHDDDALPYKQSRASKYHSDNDAFPGADEAFQLSTLERNQRKDSTPASSPAKGKSSSSSETGGGNLTIANLQAAFAPVGISNAFFAHPVDQPNYHRAASASRRDGQRSSSSAAKRSTSSNDNVDRAIKDLVMAVVNSPLSSPGNSRNPRTRSNSDSNHSNPSCGSGSERVIRSSSLVSLESN